MSAAVLAALTPADWILLRTADTAELVPVDAAADPTVFAKGLSELRTAAAVGLELPAVPVVPVVPVVPEVVVVPGARLVSV